MTAEPIRPVRLTAEVLSAGDVRVDLDDAVATVLLDRAARRNAMTPLLWHALAAVPDLLPPHIEVVLVRGAGRDFCAGLDLRLTSAEGVPGEGGFVEYFADQSDHVLAATLAEWQQAFLWLRDPRWVTIAAVQGAAVGAGFQLALSADLLIAAEDARFCMREAALGLVPDMTGTKGLHARVGYAHALEICAGARWVDAAEAHRLGIAHAVVDSAELAADVHDRAAALAATSGPAKNAIKRLLLALEYRDAVTQGRAEGRAQVPLLRDLVEGIRNGSWGPGRA